MATKNYGFISSLALDPIEKKPLYHFFPGSTIISVGGLGCNMRCPFCQNHEIAHPTHDIPTRYISPKELCEIALSYKDRGNIGVAFTYNEPLLYCDYIRDTSVLLKKSDLKTVVVTNGCFGNKVIDMMKTCVDAANVDLKAFSASGYKSIGGDLNRVKNFIEAIHKDVHVEITSLIVPGLNDSLEEMERESQWIARLDSSIPLHITRFFPNYKMKHTPPTSLELLKSLKEIAMNHLENVYLGNV